MDGINQHDELINDSQRILN